MADRKRIKFPGFKILDGYITRKFLGTYVFAIALIIVIVVVFDAVEKMDDFITTKASLKAVALDYYLNFIPYFINQFSGLFTFIAVIFFTSKWRTRRKSSPSFRAASASAGSCGPTSFRPCSSRCSP